MTKPLDIDALLEDEEDEPVGVTPVTLGGESFMVRKDVNAFQLARLSDPNQTASALTRILVDAVIPDERDRFVEVLGSIERLTVKKLMAILDAVVGAAADGVPTKSVPASRRTTPKKAVARRSVAH